MHRTQNCYIGQLCQFAQFYTKFNDYLIDSKLKIITKIKLKLYLYIIPILNYSVWANGLFETVTVLRNIVVRYTNLYLSYTYVSKKLRKIVDEGYP